MASRLPWSVAVAILVTAPVVGKLLDAAFHRTYDPRLRARLFEWAIQFDEISYVQLIHRDATRGLRILESLFGKSWHSWRFAALSALPPLLITAGWAAASRIDANDLGGLAIYVIASVLIGSASLLITKGLLARAGPRLGRLTLLLSADLVSAYLLGALPWVIPYTWATWAIFGDPAGATFLRALSGYLVQAAEEPGIEPMLLYGMFVVAILPTCVHLVLILRDLTIKLLLRPFARFLSGLLEFLSGEKQPLAWLFGVLGSVPAVVKAWLEVLG